MGILTDFLRRVPLAPGVYELRRLTVKEARQVAEWLARERLALDGTYPWLSWEDASAGRFGLPSVNGFPAVEIIFDEVTEASLAQLAREIGPRAETIVAKCTWRFAEWKSVLPEKVRRKKDIPVVLPKHPEVVLHYGAALGASVPSLARLIDIPGVGKTYGPALKRAPGPEILLGTQSEATPTLGKTLALWVPMPSGTQRRAEEMNIFQMDPTVFAGLWQKLDISPARVRDLLLEDRQQLVLRREKETLERDLGQQGKTWLDVVRKAIAQGADPSYALHYMEAIVKVRIVERYTAYKELGTARTLDPLRILAFLEILRVTTQGRSATVTAWARVTDKRRDDLVELLRRPNYDVLQVTIEVIL